MVEGFAQEYTLWKKCFSDTEEYTDYYFQEKTKDNIILRMFRENELVSMVHLNPYTICWQGREQTLYYIVGVCTEENHRKKGYMRKLLKESFLYMEKKGCPFTYLMPAKKEIYEPFDFHFIYTQKRLKGQLARQELAAAEKKSGLQVRTFEELAQKEKEEAAGFQNRKLSERFDLYALRSIRYLERLSKEMKAAGGELLFFYDKNGKICATVAYMAEEAEGNCEAAESILEAETAAMVFEALEERLLERKDSWNICFLELGFWPEKLYQWIEDAELFEKPVIMAKVLGAEEKKEELLEKLKTSRVYLNEIV